jgi:hypothetical protein
MVDDSYHLDSFYYDIFCCSRCWNTKDSCNKIIIPYKGYMGYDTMISNKGFTLHWDQIVVLILIIVGVALTFIFIFMGAEAGLGMMGVLMDVFKKATCQVFGGFMGWMMGC